jgi:predicted DNA-binding transcriptional regulator AlpA
MIDQNNALPAQKIYSQREAAKLFGVSVTTWRRYVAAGHVPRPVRVGPRRLGWLDDELKAVQDAWRRARSPI